jgi:hypothetical protein
MLTLCLATVTAQASLLYRAGGQAYYDDVLNITWVADANLAQTSGYDDDGKMDWYTAHDWIASLNTAIYLGVSNWRLPQVAPVNGVSFSYSTEVDGSTDLGYNISAPGSAYAGTTANEMAHLHYNTLGNPSLFPLDGSESVCSEEPPYCMVNSGPFANIQANDDNYWSDAHPGFPLSNPEEVFDFYFSDGGQSGIFTGIADPTGSNEYFKAYSWAVAPGDFTTEAIVPVPPALWLLGSALGVMGVMRRKVSS